MRASLERFFNWLWYSGNPWAVLVAILLLPLSCIYFLVTCLHRVLPVATQEQATFPPVVVVGNLVAGGSGKTPVVLSLLEGFAARGLRAAVVSRGHGGSHLQAGVPQQVNADSDPRICGDEPVLIARRCAENTPVPVMIARRRVDAIAELVKDNAVDVIVSDDGLQHREMQRDYELVVSDVRRGWGNGLLLPAGPLRSLPRRLAKANALLQIGGPGDQSLAMRRAVVGVPDYESEKRFLGCFTLRGERVADEVLAQAASQSLHAVTGIARPESFFALLETLLPVSESGFRQHAFPDHHDFSAADFSFANASAIVMTEKDAVKCRQFEALVDVPIYQLRIAVDLPDTLLDDIEQRVRSRSRAAETEQA